MRLGHCLAMVATAALLAFGATDAQAACNRIAEAKVLEAGLLDWINAERRARGLSPYKRSGKLDRSAEFQACDMARYGYFNHSRPGGPKLGARIKATGYPLKAANENLAYSRQKAVSSAATIWRNSPPHWSAIVDPSLRDIGLSVVEGGGRILWVMNVARPKTR